MIYSVRFKCLRSNMSEKMDCAVCIISTKLILIRIRLFMTLPPTSVIRFIRFTGLCELERIHLLSLRVESWWKSLPKRIIWPLVLLIYTVTYRDRRRIPDPTSILSVDRFGWWNVVFFSFGPDLLSIHLIWPFDLYTFLSFVSIDPTAMVFGKSIMRLRPLLPDVHPAFRLIYIQAAIRVMYYCCCCRLSLYSTKKNIEKSPSGI